MSRSEIEYGPLARCYEDGFGSCMCRHLAPICLPVYDARFFFFFFFGVIGFSMDRYLEAVTGAADLGEMGVSGRR